MAGIGIPYGNSYQLPNVKQFWAGGNSDLRGFASRLLGPGTFNEQTVYGTNKFIETLGDMKLEMNLELRQHLYKIFNLGVFMDAGNIWLSHYNAGLPGSQFSGSFYKELAVDAGAGLRLDFKILILRLDLGIPLRKPWLPENDRWVTSNIRLADPKWRKENFVFNLAIGYPF
jgi:outer membrane protein assembly factor BamA